MLVVETIARIRRDHLVRGVPIKKIARDLRVSKNTVRKVVRGDETSYSYERKIQPMPKLGPWVDELERQLEANEKRPRRDRLSLLRICMNDLAALLAMAAELRSRRGLPDAVRRYARTWQGFVPPSIPARPTSILASGEQNPRRIKRRGLIRSTLNRASRWAAP